MTARLTVEQVPLGDLRPYPGNARRGDVDAIAESLERNGQYRPLVVQRSTGYVLGGNHTLQAAQRLRWPTVQVTYLDVDDDAARRIMLADNRTADLGAYDDRALLALLRDLGDDLSGTGYEEEDYDALLASLDEPGPQEPTALIPADRPPAVPREAPSYSDYEAAYASDARILALPFPPDRHAWVVEKLSKAAADRGLESHADALLALLTDAYDEEPPP